MSGSVLNQAMSAMSLIKQQGANQFCYYSPELITVEKDFWLALKNEALQIFLTYRRCPIRPYRSDGGACTLEASRSRL